MRVKVSVITPVYNVEKYIGECLDSLINQTLKEIEIICVDDGSTDGTLDILRKYEAEDARIKVIQQQNLFAGVARNNGMKIATGEYMIFLDSDDFFEENMLEKMYEEAKRTDADLVLCGGQMFDDSTKEIKPAPWYLKTNILPKELPFSYRDTDGQLLNAISPAPWTKLFRRSFIQQSGLQFQPLQNSNDAFFIMSAVCTSERISYVDEPFVNYRKGMATNLQSSKHKAPLCFMEAYCSVYKYLLKKGVYEYVKKGFRSAVISGCIYNYDSYHYTDAASREKLLEVFQEDRFLEMNLFGGERAEYADWNKCCRLKALSEGYAWKKRLEHVRKNVKAEILVENKAAANPKVSVVIPCYNVEDYLEECVDSILNQTLKELEVICVNDGSMDSTLNVLLSIAERDSRVSVLTQENSGQGTARNKGVECAKGEYLYFMDSDDILEAEALENLYKVSKEKALDVLYFDATSFFETEELEAAKESYKTYYFRKNDYSEVVSGKDMLLAMQKNGEYRQSPCLQFIRREYFVEKELWYLQGIWHEDNSFTFKTMILADKVSHIPERYFKRRVRANSVMTSTERFIHVYGLFHNYLDMLHVVDELELTSTQAAAVAKLLDVLLGEARKKYRWLENEERFKYQCLDSMEKSQFFNFVVHSKLDVDELINDKKQLNQRIKALQMQLKQKEEEITKAKNRAEKFKKKALNYKKEKNDALNEINKIKNSKSYKLVRLVRKPAEFLRKLKRKFFSKK